MVAAVIWVWKGTNGTAFTLAPIYNAANFSMGAIMAGVAIAVFNLGGPDVLTSLGEETKGGVKTLGLGVLLSFALIGALFFLSAYAAALVWPNYKTHSNAEVAFYEIVAVAGGPILKWVFSLTVVIAVFGCCIGVQTCSSRVLYTVGRITCSKIFSRSTRNTRVHMLSPYDQDCCSYSFSFFTVKLSLTSMALMCYSVGPSLISPRFIIMLMRKAGTILEISLSMMGLSLLGYLCSLKRNTMWAGSIGWGSGFSLCCTPAREEGRRIFSSDSRCFGKAILSWTFVIYEDAQGNYTLDK
jgi:amino acid transporter